MSVNPFVTFLVAVLALNVPLRAAELPPQAAAQIFVRGDYHNSRLRFEKEKKGHVAFLGGSITENGKGHTGMIPEWLKTRFPDTAFTFTNAGIGSTCSNTGAFRLEQDVLSKGPVDLFIVEFAVNDNQDARLDAVAATRGMEGIVRHVRRHNPAADILIIHYANEAIIDGYQKGQPAISPVAHEKVAQHYGVSSVNAGAALAAGAMTWQDYGGVHPKEPGYRMVSDMIISALSKAWEAPLAADAAITPHAMPEAIDPENYEFGKFVDPQEASWMGGWAHGKVGPALLPKGSIRARYEPYDIAVASEPGATMTFAFSGRSVGAFILAGPDAGIVNASIDGGPFQPFDLHHPYSTGLNYPRTVMFFTGLERGYHYLTLRVAERPAGPPEKGGNQAAILFFNVNP